MTDRIDELLGRMSIEEKVSMLAGSDLWHGTGVPRLGIPPIKVTDGPCGARGGRYQGGTTSACFLSAAAGSCCKTDEIPISFLPRTEATVASTPGRSGDIKRM